MSWVFLGLAIAFEVGGTLSLKLFSQGRPRWLVPVALGYAASFVMLSFTLRAGMPLGAAYGIWTAAGVALIAAAGHVFFSEPIGRLSAVGLACIAGGVMLVELGR